MGVLSPASTATPQRTTANVTQSSSCQKLIQLVQQSVPSWDSADCCTSCGRQSHGNCPCIPVNFSLSESFTSKIFLRKQNLRRKIFIILGHLGTKLEFWAAIGNLQQLSVGKLQLPALGFCKQRRRCSVTLLCLHRRWYTDVIRLSSLCLSSFFCACNWKINHN